MARSSPGSAAIYGPTARPVFMGVIDDGIASPTSGSASWTAQAPHARPGLVDDGPPCTARQAGIDTLFDLCTDGNGVLDEDALLPRAGLIDFTTPTTRRRPGASPTARTSWMPACGYDPADNRLDRPIACVQLPLAVTAASTTELYALLRVGGRLHHHVDVRLLRSRGIAPLPVVINFSYGRLEGPHDGSARSRSSSNGITGIVRSMGFPVRFVLPAGNSFLARTHAQMTFTCRQPGQKINWHSCPTTSRRASSRSGPPKPLPRQPPHAHGHRSLGDSYSIDENQPSVPSAPLYGMLSIASTPTRAVFYILLPPTRASLAHARALGHLRRSSSRAPAGLAATDLIDAWVARDDTIPGYPQFGRQSYFDDALYEYRDPYSGARRRSTIAAWCNANAPSTPSPPAPRDRGRRLSAQGDGAGILFGGRRPRAAAAADAFARRHGAERGQRGARGPAGRGLP
jgi:hypothetical protein